MLCYCVHFLPAVVSFIHSIMLFWDFRLRILHIGIGQCHVRVAFRQSLKRYPVKTSQVICQNVPSDLSKCPIFCQSKSSKYIFSMFNQNQDWDIFGERSAQNIPKSNVPSQNIPESKAWVMLFASVITLCNRICLSVLELLRWHLEWSLN